MAGPPPLQGLKVLEFAGLAPGPFAGLLLADAGADVLRIDRVTRRNASNTSDGTDSSTAPDMLTRHKRSITVDLKSAGGVRLVKELARTADVIIEPFRPGVMENLGLGPETLCADDANPRLVYGRMAGFRRDGRYAAMAGHDINYLAVSGALSLLGRAGQKPHPPINILGDFAGGGSTLFQGILLAIVARARTGRGQVVEANMVDGASYLATFPRLNLNTPVGDRPRGENLFDGGCPFYDTYETRDGKYVAVGALEPQFFRVLLERLGLSGDQDLVARRHDRATWPAMRRRFEEVFRSRTRAEWETVFDGTDACCTPVLEYQELQADAAREGDQRPAVTLRETPCLAISDAKPKSSTTDHDESVARGQGPGVPGAGYVGQILAPGHGGEEALSEWFGLSKGEHFALQDGGLVLLSNPNYKSKL